MSERIMIYAVVGPTASGKSALALELAKKYGGEIVSCDSMQLYRKMDVGTAKPTAEEQKTVPHHMIDVADATDTYSCADYVAQADTVIRDIVVRGKLPIVCGGTGLYLDSLLRGADFMPDLTDGALRESLISFAKDNGAQALHDELRKIDPQSAEEIHPNNVKRVARAIEIYRLSGIKKSDVDRLSKEVEPRFDIRCVGLRYGDRERLYRRIDRRVDAMLRMGLVEETGALYGAGVFDVNSTAAQAIGYKEILPYIKGEAPLDSCVESLKTATRRYAKRQITWFSSKQYVTPLDVCDAKNEKTFEDIVNIASEVFFS